MDLRIRQRVGELDRDFAYRRVRVVACAALVGAALFGLWWPVFPFLDGYGMPVALLTGMASILLGFVLAGLALILAITILVAGWHYLEQGSESMRALRLRYEHLEREILPWILVVPSTFALLNAAVTKEMWRLKVRGAIRLSDDPVMFYAFGLVWFIALLAGISWLVILKRKSDDHR
jgi:hypothetical protein